MDLIAKRLLGIEEEIEWLRRGKREKLEKIREREKKRIRRELERNETGEDQAEDREEEEQDEDEDDEDDFIAVRARGGTAKGVFENWLGSVLKTSQNYSAVKSKARNRATGEGGSVLTRPRSKLQLEVLNRAEESTMYKVRETGLESNVERRVRNKRKASRQTNERLLELVKGFDKELKEGNKKRRKTKSASSKTTSQSLSEVEAALTLLEHSSVYE